MFKESLYKEALRKFAGEHVLRFVEKHGKNALRLGGEKKYLTMYFQDVSGFASLAEGLTPEALVGVLNEYLETMSKVILRHDGAIDKYIGSSIVAFWGIEGHKTHPSDACKCALDCLDRLADINNRFAKDKKSLKLQIGINTGWVMLGNFGSPSRLSYAVIGDTVNLASKLEIANKNYGTQILLSEFTRKELDQSFSVKEIDAVRVKGKEDPVTIFTLESMGS